MKKISNLFVMSLMAAGLVACSNDEATIGENGQYNGDKLYMKVKLDMAATRAIGDAPEEVGTADENAVKSLHLVLVGEDGNVIAKSLDGIVDAKPEVPTEKNGLYITTFKADQLVNHAGKAVKVVVYCNAVPEATVGAKFETNKTTALAGEAIWGGEDHKGGFLMTNADANQLTVTLPSSEDLYTHKTPETAYPLTTVDVERAVARFDVAAGINNKPVAADKKTETIEFNKGIQFQINDIALFNLAQNTYDIRHNSADGTLAGDQFDWTNVATHETYVVDANGLASTGLTEVGTSEEALTWINYAGIKNEANKDNWNDNQNTGNEYYFWRYVTENTFPAIGKGAQMKEAATGIGFRGEIKAADGAHKEVADAMAAGDPIYVFDNILYGNWARVKRAAEEGDYTDGDHSLKFPQNNALAAAYTKVVADAKALADAANEPFSDKYIALAAQADKKFKVFTPKNTAGEGAAAEYHYMMYYQYINIHEDGLKDQLEEPMEYGVVRNNVYKLAIEKIMMFGEPSWVEPKGEIVNKNVFFEVSVKVLPWTVRVNNITL